MTFSMFKACQQTTERVKKTDILSKNWILFKENHRVNSLSSTWPLPQILV